MDTTVTKDLTKTTTLLNSKYPSVSKVSKSTAVYLDEIRREYKMQVDGRKRHQKRQESLGNLSNRNSTSKLVENALDVVSEALKADVERMLLKLAQLLVG